MKAYNALSSWIEEFKPEKCIKMITKMGCVGKRFNCFSFLQLLPCWQCCLKASPAPHRVLHQKLHMRSGCTCILDATYGVITWRGLTQRGKGNGETWKEYTNGVGGGNEGPACQLFQQHSSHLEDLACWQTPGEQHPSIRPDRRNTEKVKSDGKIMDPYAIQALYSRNESTQHLQ